MNAPEELIAYVEAPLEQLRTTHDWCLNTTGGIDISADRGCPVGLTALRDTTFEFKSEQDLIDEVRGKWNSPLSYLPRIAGDLIRKLEDAPSPPWVYLTRLCEACVQVAEERGRLDRRAASMLPLYYRLRFLLLSAPFRPCFQSLKDHASDACPGGVEHLAERARRAREVWSEAILSHDEHVVLATVAEQGWLEQECTLLLWTDAGERSTLLRLDHEVLTSGPSDPKGRWWKGAKPLQESHRIFALRMLREFFLRRFMMWEVLRVLGKLWGGPRVQRFLHWAIFGLLMAVGALSLMGGLAQVGLLPGGVRSLEGVLTRVSEAAPFFGLASGPGMLFLQILAFFYGLTLAPLLLLVHRWGPGMAFPFALRFAGGAVLGMSVLISVPGKWWSAPGWWGVAVVLGFGALGYLIIEARAHGASRSAAWRRSLLAGWIGWCHSTGVAAVMLSTVGNVFMSPEFTAQDPGTAAQAMATGAAVGLALGVFLQMLWEDRPVTYPLTHGEWRRRG